MKAENGQLSLLPVLAMDMSINRVFSVTEKKNDAGEVVSQSLRMVGRKEFAKAHGLSPKTDKDRITEEMLKGADSLKAQLVILAQRCGNDPRFTGGRAIVRESKTGELTIGAVFKTVKRNGGPSDETIAAKLGLTLEEVREMRERQEKAIADSKLVTEVATV